VIILDTNVVSEAMKEHPDERVLAWLDEQADVCITSVTAAELLYGVNRLPDGQRRTNLATALSDLLENEFDGRVLPFDLAASVEYAQIVVERERSGRPVGMADSMIAAVALRNKATTFATRNIKDFESVGLVLVNPWG
jgi:predicted nucleic acid-binding protein